MLKQPLILGIDRTGVTIVDTENILVLRNTYPSSTFIGIIEEKLLTQFDRDEFLFIRCEPSIKYAATISSDLYGYSTINIHQQNEIFNKNFKTLNNVFDYCTLIKFKTQEQMILAKVLLNV